MHGEFETFATINDVLTFYWLPYDLTVRIPITVLFNFSIHAYYVNFHGLTSKLLIQYHTTFEPNLFPLPFRYRIFDPRIKMMGLCLNDVCMLDRSITDSMISRLFYRKGAYIRV